MEIRCNLYYYLFKLFKEIFINRMSYSQNEK
jgi:hypothetical protein